jgi:hypothetical protein
MRETLECSGAAGYSSTVMNATARGDGPTISTCLLCPFYKLLANYQLGGRGVVEAAHKYTPEARIPLEQAHKLLQTAISLTGDPDLGLKAGRISDFEDAGALAYAAGSAPRCANPFWWAAAT